MISKRAKACFILSIFFKIYSVAAMEQALDLLSSYHEIKIIKAEAFALLTIAEQEKLMPENYSKQLDESRAILKKLASLIIDKVYAQKLLTLDLQEILHLKIIYANQIIALREAVLLPGPIKVTNELTARARAAQMLTDQEKQALQKFYYLANRQRAFYVLRTLAQHAYNELNTAGLLGTSLSSKNYISQFVQDKIDTLEIAYASDI